MNESTSHSHGTVLETHHAYTLFGQIAAGGMATIRLAKQVGPHGLSQIVAVKKVHGRWAQDRDVATMFRDEIRVASRVLHPNVVKVLDVMAAKDELLLVVEYVHGESVARLLRARRHAMPVKIACTIMVGVLHGLHAAHEARSERGEPLHIIHRDVTPQNIVVGVDGSARLLDFGIAHALGRIQTTRFGQVKGKLAYMAPEQLRGEPVDRRADIYSAAATLWEMLAGRKLFNGRNQHELTQMILRQPIEAPGRLRPGLSPELDAIVLRGLQRERQNRYKTARELAIALERETETVSATVLGDWVSQAWGAGRVAREEQLREIENAEGTVYLVRPGSAGGDRVRPRTRRETASPHRGTLPREQRHDAKEPSTASTAALARVKQDVAVVAPPHPGAPGRRAVSKPSPPSRAVGRARWTGAIPLVLAVAASLLTVAVLEHARVGRTRKNPAPRSLGAAPMSPAARIERLPAMAVAPLVATHIPPPAPSAAVPPPSKSDAPPSTAAAVDVPSGSPTSRGALPVTAPSSMVGAAPASRQRACRKCRTPPSGPRESQRPAAFRTLRQRDTSPRSPFPSPAPRSGLASSPRLTTPIELDCTPPFTVDSSGIKRFKLACL